MIAALGVFLLGDLIYHAVLGMVSHLLSRPFSFGRLLQVFAPGPAANCGALQHAVCGVSLGFVACPFPLLFALMSSHQPLLPGLSAQAPSRLSLATMASEMATFRVLAIIIKKGSYWLERARMLVGGSVG